MILQHIFRRASHLRGAGVRANRLMSSARSSSIPVIASENKTSALERRLLGLFATCGEADYIGEPVTITGHSLQAMLASRQAGMNEDVQLACLMHDVGHLLGLEAGFAPGMGGCGTVDHEVVGADFLQAVGLTETVAFLTRHHVSAKRYLCWKDPGYLASLSKASATTLAHQGGPMTAAEAAEAESDPRWPLVLAVRQFDEAAKDPFARLPAVRDVLRPLLDAHFAAEAARKKAFLALSVVLGDRQPGDEGSADGDAELSPSCVLSSEQLRRWREYGCLVVRGALDPSTARALPQFAEAVLLDHTTESGSFAVHAICGWSEGHSIDGEASSPTAAEAAWAKVRGGPVAQLLKQLRESTKISELKADISSSEDLKLCISRLVVASAVHEGSSIEVTDHSRLHAVVAIDELNLEMSPDASTSAGLVERNLDLAEGDVALLMEGKHWCAMPANGEARLAHFSFCL